MRMISPLSLLLGLALVCPVALSAQPPAWRLAPSPSVRIGTADKAELSLAAPAGATRLPNGNIVVGDLAEYALREFTPAGALVKRYARKGEGPGEVGYLAPLLRCGSALVANDITGPLSVFTLDGRFQRGFRFPTPTYRIACNAAMQFVAMGWASDRDMKAGAYRPNVRYWIARADTSAEVPLGTMPAGDRWREGGGDGPLPLGREPRVAISASRAYVALGDRLEVLVFDLSGKAMPPLSAPVTRVRVTKADVDAEREREIAKLGERARKMVERSFATTTMPDFLPATRDLLVDATGHVWVQHYPRASSTTVPWTVFAPDGKVRATIAMPVALEVYEIGTDYVLGRYIDPEEQVPEVRLYALIRR
ncbi:hypothetical protein [Gemmatimonas groenlandica]|uniref:6-bladed beta-propeller n=1 Tax=Gemmatimonas groenlandica TaxID=2732249 RepID=A0A6M4IPQ1_9BACT|nr:hypothetical protein [Gemmatimonas groenlandica]QJR35416.1 hypothetical protein HKW67_07800 [Gemmatimonas groenlandica]